MPLECGAAGWRRPVGQLGGIGRGMWRSCCDTLRGSFMTLCREAVLDPCFSTGTRRARGLSSICISGAGSSRCLQGKSRAHFQGVGPVVVTGEGKIDELVDEQAAAGRIHCAVRL